MGDDPFDFLTPDEPVIEPTPVVEPVAEPVQPEPEPTPAVAEVIPPVVEPVTPPAPTIPAPNFVPLAAVLDEREKRKEAERKYAELERKHQEANPTKVPTVTDDPEGWQRAQDARFEKFRLDQTMEMSGRYAAQHYGQDKVKAAMEWGNEQTASDPYFGPKFMSQQDPYGWLVDQHRRANVLGKLGDKDPDHWAIEYAVSQGYAKPAETQQQPAVTPVTVQPPPPTAPPRSIAGATPAGGSSTPVIPSDREIGDIWSK